MIRNTEGIFLTMMEQGDMWWDKTAEISKLKNRYIYNALANEKSTTTSACHDENVTPCPQYQKGVCPTEKGRIADYTTSAQRVSRTRAAHTTTQKTAAMQ